MKKNRTNILTNASIYVVGSFFTQGLTFITLPLFSRLMDPEAYGLYSSYNFWISIIGIVLGLQLSSSIGNAVIDFGKNNIYKYITSIIGLGFNTFIVILVITGMFIHPLSALFEIKESALLLGVVQGFFAYIFSCLISAFRFLEQPFKYIGFSISNALLNISLSLLLLLFFVNDELYMNRVYSSVIAALLTGGVGLCFICTKKEKWNNLEYWKYGLKISVPLIFHSLAALVFAKIDQMILLKMLDSSSAGMYSYSNNIGQIISVLYMALNQAFVPWYYQKMSNEETELIKKVNIIYIRIFTLIFVVILLIIPEVIIWLSDEKYYSSVNIIPILFASYFMNFLYTFPVNYEFYLKKTKYIALGTIMSMIVNIILDFLLIPTFGGIGAAFATYISYTILFALHYYIARYRIQGYELSIKYFVSSIIIVVMFVVAYYLLRNYIGIRYIIAALIMGVCCRSVFGAIKNIKNK